MKTKSFAYTLLAFLLLTSCTLGSSPEPIPTPVDIGTIQTAVVQTVVAAVTQTAESFTSTPAPTQAPTSTPAPTETPAPAGSPTPAICDAMQYLEDVSVSDGSTMAAGQEFVKTWKVKNTGACTWKTNYTIVWGYGDIKIKTGWLPTSLTAEVLPDAEAEISITLKAPTQPGTYNGWWRLQNNNGYPFGKFLSVNIVVP